MQSFALFLVIFAFLGSAFTARVQIRATRQPDSTDKPLIEPAIVTNEGELLVSMHNNQYKIRDIYETMKEIRGLSKAMREQLQKKIKNNTGRRGLEPTLDEIIATYGLYLIFPPAAIIAGIASALPQRPLRKDELMEVVLKLAFGTSSSTKGKEPVRELVHNLLKMKQFTKDYKFAYSQHVEQLVHQSASFLKRKFGNEEEATKFEKRQEQMSSLVEFMRDLQGVSNPTEVLECWKAPIFNSYYLGAMVNSLVEEAELWQSFGVQEPDAETAE